MKTDHQWFLDHSVSPETHLQEDETCHPQAEFEPDHRHHVKHSYWVHDTLPVYTLKIKSNLLER